MKKMLLKLKLIQIFTSNSSESMNAFEENLLEKIDYTNFGFMSDATDVFSTSKNRFKGNINEHRFKLKHKRTFFSGIASIPTIKGQFIQNGDQVKTELEINAFTGTYRALSILVVIGILINTILLILILSGKTSISNQILLPLIFSITAFPLAIYISMRSALRFLRKRVSSELFHLEPIPNIDV